MLIAYGCMIALNLGLTIWSLATSKNFVGSDGSMYWGIWWVPLLAIIGFGIGEVIFLITVWRIEMSKQNEELTKMVEENYKEVKDILDRRTEAMVNFTQQQLVKAAEAETAEPVEEKKEEFHYHDIGPEIIAEANGYEVRNVPLAEEQPGEDATKLCNLDQALSDVPTSRGGIYGSKKPHKKH